MNSFYIYSCKYEEEQDDILKEISATVIFCSCEDIDESDLRSEIKTYYEEHYQTDRIFIIGSNKGEDKLKDIFIEKQESTFKGIPKRQETALGESLNLFSFDKNGTLTHLHGSAKIDTFLTIYLNEGLQNIFISRGGLIVSESAHHYVFPSKKHCDRFLRTGNILLYSPEIFFIAFALLPHFDEEKYSRIYCDTSSINSIAFALFDLKNSFLPIKHKVSIESFSSYEGLYKNPQQYTKDSFLLISASTSTNIIKYILDLQSTIDRDNIIVLYFLAGQADFGNVKDQVLCNLTRSERNPNGIPFYQTFSESNCELCKSGSYAVPVSGDVFLLEAPKINKILLAKTDRDNNLSKFVWQFKSFNKESTILKVHYKERTQNKYEIYIDFEQIVKNIVETQNCKEYKTKLHDYIHQYIPGNTKYILYLMDKGSEKFANYIYEYIKPLYNDTSLPILLDQDHIDNINLEDTGTVLIAGSCISNGKNLLYISRALRKFDKLRIVYFIGIVRTSSKEYMTILKNNLSMGRYGAETHSFYAVETMYCSNNSKSSPWMKELDFLKGIINFIQDKLPTYNNSLLYFENRKSFINTGAGDEYRGLSVDLFFPRLTTNPNDPLGLRKGFAFWDFMDYEKHIVQSDTYFTISSILNSLRNSENTGRHLKQAVYVRNILDPANFNRFNDGIIQASLLRAAQSDELSYDMNSDTSQEMYNILETIIIYHKQQQGEALMEFLYAIAIKKLTLFESHLRSVLQLVNEKCDEELLLCIAAYIQLKLIDEPAALKSKPLPPKMEITILSKQVEDSPDICRISSPF